MRDKRCTVGRTALTLAVIAVIIGGDGRLVDSRGVGDGATEAVTGERHVDDGVDSRKVLRLGKNLVGESRYLVGRGEPEVFKSKRRSS